jgi:DNA-binding response OmpR family regulator
MSAAQTILVVDDEAKILELVKSYLQRDGYRVLCAKTGRQALDAFKTALASGAPVNLVLLDLMLPDLDGETVCRTIRAETPDGYGSTVPIIMLTAKVDEASIVHGLSIGADDYISKPFSPRELVARVKAALRRTISQGDNGGGGETIVCADIVIDTESRTVSKDGGEIKLTPNEYKILSLLASRPQKIFTRDEIIERALGDDDFAGFDRTVDTHIKNLRSKLGDDPKSPRYIITVYGTGYRMAR